ncbi:MAG: epoxyqueuosine reductase QueH [Candidatus Berkelbacteria bacterium]|nr:epoxyqueuosine reductase QueH [Candidatus Berkelbacteria bacterium]
MKKKILIHSCCAPCSTYVYKALIIDGFNITGFFYNPNIHGVKEYRKRLKSMKKWGKIIKKRIIVPEYYVKDYFEALLNYEKEHHRQIERDKKRRCQVCFSLRLRKTAEEAKSKKFDFFTTTLLVSPYQDQSLLWQIGSDVGSEVGVDFYFRDFRKGYLASRHLARINTLYQQKYCGCVYSIDEKTRE